jgi:hypothetical protein
MMKAKTRYEFNRHIFARNDEELVCASLAARQ